MPEISPEGLPPVETNVDDATLNAGLAKPAESDIAAQIKAKLDEAKLKMENGSN